MDKTEYKTVSTGRGGKLRELADSMLTDARYLPGKQALADALAELYPDERHEALRKALRTKLADLAEAAQDRSRRFELGQKAAQMVLDVEKGLAAEDRLVAPAEEEPVDMDAIMKATDSYSDRIGGDLDREHDQEVAEAQELLRKAGRL